ncbi:diaminopimelate decarboxylase family protein [Olsenella profusa]|uniref:Diaminopimelate decarboxylase n=1 Tax=Olsenella profusa TaxID=138595 RepID=A0ABS2F2J5_9ACTN|nr:diaminopimelate decarboxylase [Olsenella profusa]MBM6774792.1 diaminopimelate decarboxylase [Olsenella profusa]
MERISRPTPQKRPFVTKDQLEAIAAEHPTPFYLYDEAEIRRRAAELAAAFSWNPGFKEYFAVKATPNPWIVSILAECGCGCDCATGTELMLAEAAGVTGRNVMLSSNDTPDEDFRAADELGAIINLDGADMVDCLVRALGGRVPRTVCCRVNPGGSFEASNGIIGSPEDSKFGMTEPQLEESFRRLSALGVQEFGIHAFLASNTQVNDYYPRLARLLFEMAVRLSRELGVHVGFVDLSGGIGVAYRPEDTPCDLAVIGEGVRQAFEEVLVPAGMGDVAIFTELGRWMLAPAGALVTRVIHEKVTYRDYLGVDACAANLMRPAVYDAYHHITVMGSEDVPATRRYNVVGRLCENNDQFARDRLLPPCGIGDLLFIHDAGAHGFSMGYNYNGSLRSAELLLRCDGSVQQIRRAETPADYFATFDDDPRFFALARPRRKP